MGAGDSKLAFRTRITKLVDQPILSNDHDFWKELFTSQLTIHDMYGLLTPEDIRAIREKQPGNAQLILYKAIEQLHLFSNLKNPSYDHTSAVNSLRLLSRSLPFLFEHDDDGLIDSFFFQNKMFVKKRVAEVVVKSDPGVEEVVKTDVVVETPEVVEKIEKQPVEEIKEVKEQIITHIGQTALESTLAQFMISTIYNCLFLPAFTLPIGIKEEFPETEDAYDVSVERGLVWDGGLCVSNYGRTPASDQVGNRVECIRTLISVFSGALYFKASEIPKFENRFVSIGVSKPTPHLSTLLYSLLNVILNYNPTGSFAYSSQFFSDSNEELVEYACHLVCILIHSKKEDNEFLQQLKSMKSEKDFALIYKAISVLLGNIVQSHNTYLPNSQKMFDCFEEVLIIFWKLIEENKPFKTFICKSDDITQVLIPILFLIHINKTDHTKFPLVQLSCFILLSLSGSREFGVGLNKSFDTKVPLEYPSFSGSYGELLILVLHKIMVGDKGLLRPLFDLMLTVICNVSPYLKSVSMVGCSKLIGLFEAFASKRFLLSAEKNHQYVFLLIETFNNLIQYQYEGSVHLVYSILRRKDSFVELCKKIDGEEIKKITAKREEKKVEEPVKIELESQKKAVFVPTEEWTESWRSKLPLKTIMTLIKIMVPDVEKLVNGADVATEEDVLLYLKKTTLVGLLPVPHTIVIRTFTSTPLVDVFLTTYIWGLVYLRTLNPQLFDKSSIKLFQINIIE